MSESDLPEVRAQYGALPYPSRNPEDERRELKRTWLDDLPMVNHYGFAGRQSFASGFRALVAGGGTGDATIFLAEQLRGCDAEVVHLDFSVASTAIARKRAEIRGLGNIRWVEASLLDLRLRWASARSTTSTARACCTTWPIPTRGCAHCWTRSP